MNSAALACPALNSDSAIPIAATRRTIPGIPLILAIFTSAMLGGYCARDGHRRGPPEPSDQDKKIAAEGGSTFSAIDAI